MTTRPKITSTARRASSYHGTILLTNQNPSVPACNDDLERDIINLDSSELYKIEPQHSLLLEFQRTGCPNSITRAGMWLKDQKLVIDSVKMGFLSQLSYLCITSGVRICEDQECKKLREAMHERAPKCDWKSFRDWTLVAMSCQAAMAKKGDFSVGHTHLAHTASSCCLLLKEFLSKKKGLGERYFVGFLDGHLTQVDLAGAVNLIYWMGTIQTQAGIGPRSIERWDRRLIIPRVIMPSIDEAVRQVEHLDLCKNRVWTLVDVSDRKEADLHDIIAVLKRVNPDDSTNLFRHEGHQQCVPSKCQLAQMDSSKVKQLHMCGGRGDCGLQIFPVDLLETSLALNRGTAWSFETNRNSKPDEPYIAISHVWADGTGVGQHPPGTVTKCLFRYFADIAKRLDCTAIWWDAISIPQEPKARSKALNGMHYDYYKAHCTVVHDKYLVNFPWDDKGGPCLALVLSSWFTRGWTALELIMSGKTVKVLFRDPDTENNIPLIKDLDTDILATSPATSSRGHWLATVFVQRLRRTVIREARDLLAVLRPPDHRSASRTGARL